MIATAAPSLAPQFASLTGRAIPPDASPSEPPDPGTVPQDGPGSFDDSFERADVDAREPSAEMETAQSPPSDDQPSPGGEAGGTASEGAALTRWTAVEYRISASAAAEQAPSPDAGARVAQDAGAVTGLNDRPIIPGTDAPTTRAGPIGTQADVSAREEGSAGTIAPGTTRRADGMPTAAEMPADQIAGAPGSAQASATKEPDAAKPGHEGTGMPDARETATDGASRAGTEGPPPAHEHSGDSTTFGEAAPPAAADPGAEERNENRKGPRDRSAIGRADRTEATAAVTDATTKQTAEGNAAAATLPGANAATAAAGNDAGAATDAVITPFAGAEAGADTGAARMADRPAQGQAQLLLRHPEGGVLTAGAARQVAEMTVAARPGGVELRFEPDELGAVRLNLVTEGETVRVTVLAERPETLDLFRRNASELAAEFRALGFGGASFSFGREGRSPEGRPGFDPAALADGAAPPSAATGLGNGPTRLAARSAAASALDIRL
jgi:flagellar hook-length control protein FliK